MELDEAVEAQAARDRAEDDERRRVKPADAVPPPWVNPVKVDEGFATVRRRTSSPSERKSGADPAPEPIGDGAG